MFLGQHGQAVAHVQNLSVAFLAAETRGRIRGHGDLHELGFARSVVIEVLQPRCIFIVRPESSGREGLKLATYQVGKQTQLQFTVNMYPRPVPQERSVPRQEGRSIVLARRGRWSANEAKPRGWLGTALPSVQEAPSQQRR